MKSWWIRLEYKQKRCISNLYVYTVMPLMMDICFSRMCILANMSGVAWIRWHGGFLYTPPWREVELRQKFRLNLDSRLVTSLSLFVFMLGTVTTSKTKVIPSLIRWLCPSSDNMASKSLAIITSHMTQTTTKNLWNQNDPGLTASNV